MTNRFDQSFNNYVCEGDTITAEIDGFVITARIEHDHDQCIYDDDCHSTDQSVTGCNDEQFKKLLAARDAWFNNEWFYCGVVLSISKNGIELDNTAASLWGIECNYPESDNSYLTRIASDLLDEALQAGRDILKKLCGNNRS